ncbi:hypothetical protein [Paracidovorax citrulli]
MKRIATLMTAMLFSAAAWSQTAGTGTAAGSDRAPGTAASDVAPGPTKHAPTTGEGPDKAQSGARQHDATKGTSGSRKGEARQSNSSSSRSASAAQSYGYPASDAKGR